VEITSPLGELSLATGDETARRMRSTRTRADPLDMEDEAAAATAIALSRCLSSAKRNPEGYRRGRSGEGRRRALSGQGRRRSCSRRGRPKGELATPGGPISSAHERTRPAGGGTGLPSTSTSTNSSLAPALDGAPPSGWLSDFEFDLRFSFEKNSICKGVFAK